MSGGDTALFTLSISKGTEVFYGSSRSVLRITWNSYSITLYNETGGTVNDQIALATNNTYYYAIVG